MREYLTTNIIMPPSVTETATPLRYTDARARALTASGVRRGYNFASPTVSKSLQPREKKGTKSASNSRPSSRPGSAGAASGQWAKRETMRPSSAMFPIRSGQSLLLSKTREFSKLLSESIPDLNDVTVARVNASSENLWPEKFKKANSIEFPHSRESSLAGAIAAAAEVSERTRFKAARTKDERMKEPEKLDLCGRDLESCLFMLDEERLRFLSYDANRISKIEFLDNLANLIKLEMSDNQIKEIEGLSSLVQLRVLVLGNNQISRIKNLQGLAKLESLDLRGNQISEIENIDHLSNLRSLNLQENWY
ncbi:MAG: hypothetical protein SGCHY_003195 [Lobulomycetales sp.]